jgi:hypothetical protein
MRRLKRPAILAVVVLALVVAFAAGTMAAPSSPAALTPGQSAAVQTSGWLATSRVEYVGFLPLVIRQ